MTTISTGSSTLNKFCHFFDPRFQYNSFGTSVPPSRKRTVGCQSLVALTATQSSSSIPSSYPVRNQDSKINRIMETVSETVSAIVLNRMETRTEFESCFEPITDPQGLALDTRTRIRFLRTPSRFEKQDLTLASPQTPNKHAYSDSIVFLTRNRPSRRSPCGD